jgi:SAM-dependent methyltransferase
MSFQELKIKYAEMASIRDRAESLDEIWLEYAELVRETDATLPPPHLITLLKTVRDLTGDRDPSEIKILDHGCGGGMTLLYLLALGYTNVYGVDVGTPRPMWNPLMKDVFGVSEQRFFIYEGGRMPFEDACFDFIFSQQVLEHVNEQFIETYYAEEGRILKDGAIVFHEVPHRLYPYDSHTRTWFIHMFPRSIQRILYPLTGNDPDYVFSMLHLRWVSVHFRMVQKHIGHHSDHTMERFLRLTDLSDFDGPKKLRKIVRFLVTMPILGPIFAKMVRNAVQVDTTAVKGR